LTLITWRGPRHRGRAGATRALAQTASNVGSFRVPRGFTLDVWWLSPYPDLDDTLMPRDCGDVYNFLRYKRTYLESALLLPKHDVG
jgi:hypothetical protein